MLKIITLAMLVASPALAIEAPAPEAKASNIKACGVAWKEFKLAAQSDNDKAWVAAGWPKFWSLCNTQMKAGKPAPKAG